MAINVSNAIIKDDARQDLLGSKVSSALTVGGGTNPNVALTLANPVIGLGSYAVGKISESDLAGITSDFVSNFKTAMDTYVDSVKTAIAELTAVDSSVAFQGEGLKGALANFVTEVENVANKYSTALKNAENEIVQSVEDAYKEQDSDISGNLKSDTTELSDSGPNVAAITPGVGTAQSAVSAAVAAANASGSSTSN